MSTVVGKKYLVKVSLTLENHYFENALIKPEQIQISKFRHFRTWLSEVSFGIALVDKKFDLRKLEVSKDASRIINSLYSCWAPTSVNQIFCRPILFQMTLHIIIFEVCGEFQNLDAFLFYKHFLKTMLLKGEWYPTWTPRRLY